MNSSKEKVCELGLLLPPYFNILPVKMCFPFQRKTSFSLKTYLCNCCFLFVLHPVPTVPCILTVLQHLCHGRFSLYWLDQELLCGAHQSSSCCETCKESGSCSLGQELETREPRNPDTVFQSITLCDEFIVWTTAQGLVFRRKYQ